MNTYLHSIAPVVPEHAYPQDYASRRMERWVGDPQTARLVRQVYRRSGIQQRHSVLGDFRPGAVPRLFCEDADGRLVEPSTHERNRCFIETAKPLALAAARQALAAAPAFTATDVTHVVTVSCTGFYNPGPDYQIVTELGLAPSTERYHLGFMGCYGAFPALRMAQQFCQARPDAVVLVVCLELCSLHLQVRPDLNTLLANALFADGAAGVVVSARPPMPDQPALRIDSFFSALATEGHKDMAWEIGNHGFNIVLSSYVPDVIGMNVGQIVADLLQQAECRRTDIDLWAIHPGGKAILDKVEAALCLRPEQIQAARDILHDYGNMSSATVLFVLHRLLQSGAPAAQRICSMAFGPGLVIETGLLEYVPAAVPQPAAQIVTR